MTPEGVAAAARAVQGFQYIWPADPDASSTRARRAGSCAGKHAVLAEDLAAFGLVSNPMLIVGPLVPSLWGDLLVSAGHLLEVHECLVVETPWAGPLLVDVTWHPAAIRHGLPGTVGWDGTSDMTPAVDPVRSYAVSRRDLRTQKEALRSRLYSEADRLLRDQTLAAIAARAVRLG